MHPAYYEFNLLVIFMVHKIIQSLDDIEHEVFMHNLLQ